VKEWRRTSEKEWQNKTEMTLTPFWRGQEKVSDRKHKDRIKTERRNDGEQERKMDRKYTEE
jgi:hypothetical protein